MVNRLASLQPDERGIITYSVDLVFSATVDEPFAWSEIATSVGLITPDESKDDWEARVFALPADRPQNPRVLVIDVHEHSSHQMEAFWTLRYAVGPMSDPPDTVLQDSNRVGGYPGVLEKIGKHWNRVKSLKTSTIQCTYFLPKLLWKSRLEIATTPLSLLIANQSIELSPKVMSFSLNPTLDGLEEVSISAIDEGLIIGAELQSSTDIIVDESLMVNLDRQSWSILENFMEKRI